MDANTNSPHAIDDEKVPRRRSKRRRVGEIAVRIVFDFNERRFLSTLLA